MTTVMLDGNIFDKLRDDPEARSTIAKLVKSGDLRVIATPLVVDELRASPFGGVPNYFEVNVVPEAVTVLGDAKPGMARLGHGEACKEHQGKSRKIKDAIITQSAHALAGIFVSEDQRCRKRLSEISSQCRAFCYAEFRDWLFSRE